MSNRCAEAPELIYTRDDQPGYRRVARGRTFRYLDVHGAPLKDERELARIRRLAIPPGYQDVWICPQPHGHLQATERDARGRKQYRYHPDWLAAQAHTKFDRLADFGRALPRIRRRVAADLARPVKAISRTLVLATIVRLLDTTYARIGNEAYLRDNGSYGLTTLRNRHAQVRGGVLHLSFRGKSGVTHHLSVQDTSMVRVVRRCQQLPGQALFEYLDETGQVHTVNSGDVNAYLAEAAGKRFTAKDFRTWHGSVQALALAQAFTTTPGKAASVAEVRTRVNALVAEVAKQLGNTVAVCRKFYIHPAVLAQAAAWAAQPAGSPHACGRDTSPRPLHAAERQLLQFLQGRS